MFVLVAALVSSTVDLAARRTRQAARAAAESRTLANLAGSVLAGDDALADMLQRVRETFALTSVTLLERDEDGWVALANAGPAVSARGRRTPRCRPATGWCWRCAGRRSGPRTNDWWVRSRRRRPWWSTTSGSAGRRPRPSPRRGQQGTDRAARRRGPRLPDTAGGREGGRVEPAEPGRAAGRRGPARAAPGRGHLPRPAVGPGRQPARHEPPARRRAVDQPPAHGGRRGRRARPGRPRTGRSAVSSSTYRRKRSWSGPTPDCSSGCSST